MDQNSILAVGLLPFVLFWVAFSAECSSAKSLRGSSRKIVDWLIGFAVQLAIAATLVLLVLGFLLSLGAFFGFEYLKSEGLVRWFFGLFFAIVIVEAIVVIQYRIFLTKAKRNNLIE